MNAEDRSLPRNSFDPEAAVDVVLPSGGLFLIHPYTIHGSGENNSDRPRRLFLNGFAFPGANSRKYPGEGSGRMVRALRQRGYMERPTSRTQGPPTPTAIPLRKTPDTGS